MPKAILYHGTARDFDAFDGRYALRGSEANSALGIHLTEDPAVAAEYAEMAGRDRGAGTPRVLEVEVEVSRVALVSSREDFLGRPDDVFGEDDGARTREEFVAARHRLEAEGFDAVAGDCLGDDLSGCWAVFDPARISVVRRLSPEEAMLSEAAGLPRDVEFVPVELFEGEAAVTP